MWQLKPLSQLLPRLLALPTAVALGVLWASVAMCCMRFLAGVPPVCLRVYFCTVLEQRLMSALLLLAAAKKELPAAVDSGRKEMAFLANALFDS